MKWPVRATGDPKRGLPLTAGSFVASSFDRRFVSSKVMRCG